MANLFDSANFPTKEPETLLIGDRWMWKRVDLGSDYPPASYALSYSMQFLGDGGHTISITATGSGTDFVVEVASATTAGYTAGTYRWFAFITRNSDSQRVEIGSGSVTIAPNAASGHHDTSSHAEIMVRKIESVLQNRADADVASYSIAGRSLSKMSPEELTTWRDYYRAEVVRERRAERMANGLGTNSQVLVRFVP